jgi:GNAT superfamily N-acetyltransferase
MPVARDRAARAYELLRTGGVRRGGWQILKKLAKRIYHRQDYIILEKRLDQSSSSDHIARSGAHIAVREGSQAEVLAFTSAISDNSSPAAHRALTYLSQNYKCALGFEDGAPIAQWWWTDRRLSEKSRNDRDLQMTFFEIDLDEGDAWCFKNEVLPSHRGHGRATAFVSEIEHMLYLKGYRRMFGYVEADNIPARWLYELRQLQPIKRVSARYVISLIGFSNGRVFVRVNERLSGPATFPYRPLRRRGGRHMRFRPKLG